MPVIIKDTLITFLRSLRVTDFNSSSSTIYLKEEISKSINKITTTVELLKRYYSKKLLLISNL